MDNRTSDFLSQYQAFVSQPEIHLFGHIIGLSGMACIVVAYFMIEQGRLNRDDVRYYWLNLAGAALLEVSLLINFNLGSFVIEIFWIAISIFGLRRLRRQKNMKKV
jgi:hypothetical protein